MLEIVCGYCGGKLYIGMDVKSPRQILRIYGWRCKFCGKELKERDFQLIIERVI